MKDEHRTTTFSDRACWIAAADEGFGSWWRHRKEFALADGIVRATLLVTSCSYHEVHLDGVLLGRGPARSFDFDKTYDAIDVTRRAGPGRHALAILSPQVRQKDAPFMLHPPGVGVLCELVVAYADGREERIATDGNWKSDRCGALLGGTAWYAIPLGPEEHFDARLDDADWLSAGFDDRGWTDAHVLGPIGTAPWTGMRLSRLPLQSDDLVHPKRVLDVELAETPTGTDFRLGPANDGIMVFLTRIEAATDIPVRVRFTTDMDVVYVDGCPADPAKEILLSRGTHLFAFRQLCYGAVEPELRFETSEPLTFSSGIFDDAKWALFTIPTVTLAYPWHDKPEDLVGGQPDVARLLACTTLEGIPPDLREQLLPAVAKPASSFHHVVAQRRSPAPQGTLLDRQDMLHGGEGACTVLPPADGRDVHFVLDFGQERIGFIELDLDATAGTVLDVQGFELVDGAGIAWMHVHNGFRYFCKEGPQTYVSHYRRGFRYLSVTVRSAGRPVRIRGIRCRHAAYPVDEVGAFECSDSLLNEVFRMSLTTAELCMLDSYVDCPGHEQNFWVGDARITALINLQCLGARDLNQSFVRIVGQSLRAEWVRTYWPNDPRYLEGRYLPIAAFPDYPEGGLPMWTFQWILQIWEHWLHGGDREDLEENFAYVEGTLENCRRLTNERGLFDMPGAWNLIEWANNDLSPYGEVTANNALLVLCLRRAADMARALGRAERAQAFDREADARTAAIGRLCWDEDRRAFVDTVRDEWAYERYLAFAVQKDMKPLPYDAYRSCSRISVQSNTLAILSGIVPDDRRADVERVVRTVEAQRFVPGAPSGRSIGRPSEEEAPGGIVAVGSPFFLFFSLDALYRIGRPDAALAILRGAWTEMIACGTNTCWETFKGKGPHWTRSIAHAWSAAPAVYLPSEVLGVKPVEPGYRSFSVSPKAGDLTWAPGTVSTPHGPIRVTWRRREDGALDIACEAPDGCRRVQAD